ARQGARVFLAEGHNSLGGMGTAGMLPVFMPFGDAKYFYAEGFGREVFSRMEEASRRDPENILPPPLIRAEALKRLYDELARETGLRLSLMTQAIAAEAGGGRVSHVVCAAKSGLFAVAARVFIDCSGDGDLCVWAGASFDKGDEQGSMMGGTLCSLWAGVDWPAVRAARQKTEEIFLAALKAEPGLLPSPDPHLPGMWPGGGSLAGGNIGHCYGVDGTDEASMTEGVIWSRKILPYYERFYRRHMKGYERVSLAATAPLLGIRETRRIQGDYVLNLGDYNRHAVFDDEIGRYNYWIDTHLPKPDMAEFEKHLALRGDMPKPGESYGIPYRCLTPRGLENVLVA
ncbi:MAG: FAD-dependent oxidoreductase, partial [bacterium]|nr:FAD-dependent oxidoreductase [bacterium]